MRHSASGYSRVLKYTDEISGMLRKCHLSTSLLAGELSMCFARVASSGGSNFLCSGVIGARGSKAIVSSIALPPLAR